MTLRIRPAVMHCDTCATLPVTERCPAACDLRFVVSGWSSSFKDSDESGMLTSEDYSDIMHGQIKRITAREECRVLLIEDHVLLGFIAAEPSERVVYYCFVKDEYRRNGIAGALFKALGIDPKSPFAYPANTMMLTGGYDDGPRLVQKIPLARRDPSVARYPKAERRRSY